MQSNDPENDQLFIIVVSVGASLLSVYTVVILGVNSYERRLILGLLTWLLFVNILATYNALDKRLPVWISAGLELYFHSIGYWKKVYEQEHKKRLVTEQKNQELEAHLTELDQEVERVTNLEQWYKNRLAERERDVAAARKHIERLEANTKEEL